MVMFSAKCKRLIDHTDYPTVQLSSISKLYIHKSTDIKAIICIYKKVAIIR